MRPPEKGFTGDVDVAGYFRRELPSRLAGGTVRFGPGARTPWKTNPCGQTLVVISGVGRMQCEGQAVVEIRAGDVIWCPPGRRHWEGAAPHGEMTYVAMHEIENGSGVVFGESVTDAEYAHGPGPAALLDA